MNTDANSSKFTPKVECHGLDTPERIHFYENDFYIFSNFSSFQIYAHGRLFPTSEHLYHYTRFKLSDKLGSDAIAFNIISKATSAHTTFIIAQENKKYQVDNWDDIKLFHMKQILKLKVDQHEYVKYKLIKSRNRELVENSFRDDYWGTGPNNDGQNMLGKLWMEIREEMFNISHPSA